MKKQMKTILLTQEELILLKSLLNKDSNPKCKSSFEGLMTAIRNA